MTPKEKAKELVKSFKPYSYYDAHDLTSRFRREESNLESAIECALIAVDEIIKQEAERCLAYKETDKFVDYWQEVKQEIENI